MNLSQYRLDKELIAIFEHLTDEQKIEVAIQKYPVKDVKNIFTYYELEQHPYAKKLFWEQYRNCAYELFYYSRDIIGGRWTEAEPTIMTSTAYAYFYSRYVIKRRWPEAEPHIMTHPYYGRLYKRSLLTNTKRP